ncbi:hypothetical protein IV203_011416 [Nitzschia inconspicua]|uniref:Uncharacterized protein n=1 Tax=Nitzschia inconspicua TaxID=303405 RepID=A0A9K3KT51_9STRA|nr:hypothetical protein IV203_011416 [Nitzschia inconspicua]
MISYTAAANSSQQFALPKEKSNLEYFVLTMSSMKSTFILPHDPLTPIIGRPTAQAIKTFTRENYGNAKSVPSNRGGGSNGHLAMVMSPEARSYPDKIFPYSLIFIIRTSHYMVVLVGWREC